MPENWKTYKLSELGSLARGKSKHRPRDASFLYGGKYPFIQTGNIKSANHKITKHSQTYSEEGLKQSKLWDEGTICITIAAHIADTAILTYPACFPDSVIGFIADKKKADVDFIEYFLQFYKRSIQSHAIGSVQDNINLAIFETIEFTIPDLPEQRRIAEILSALDEKIELNQAMNRTLERIAQATFKHWFVDFQFPGFDGELAHGLPRGWRKGKVRDVCTVNANTLSKKDDLEVIKYIEISEVSKGVVNNVSVYKKGEEPSRAKRKLLHGDIVISTVRPDRGSYFMAFYPEKDLIASTGFAVFTATSVPFSFLYIFLTDEEQITYYGRVADGGAYPAINQSVIMDIDLMIPSNEILKQFNSFAEPIFERIGYNLNETKTLTQIRDGLLPKLMSGKIRVGEIDMPPEMKKVL